MDTKQKAKRMREIINHSIDTYERKNEAYGDSFSKGFNEFGEVSLVIRLFDKYSRIKTLLFDGVENRIDDESVKDTLIDLANYALMAVVELEGKVDERLGGGCSGKEI